MNTSACLFLVQMLSLISPSEGDKAYTGDELKAVQALGTSLGVKSFVFVRNHDHLEELGEFRDFCKSDKFCAIMSSCRLDDTLRDANQKEMFFGLRSVFVTKEDLNFTNVLKKLAGLHTITWVVFIKSLTELRNSYIPMNINFFVVQIVSSRIIVNRAYNVKPGFDTSLEYTGTLSERNSLITRGIGKRKINFRNATMTLLHYSSEESCKNGSVTYVLYKIECFHQEIIRMSSRRLNFGIKEVVCPERQYPYNYPNGSYSDFFTILTRREVDISAGSYIVNERRLPAFDFIWPTFTTSSMMYIKFRGTELDWEAFVRPVSSQVWKAIASWIIITGFLIHVFEESRSGNFKLRFFLLPKLVKSVLATLQVFCNQGVHNISQWYSDRIVFLLTYLLFVSLYQIYTGCLISSLTVALPDVPFRNIREFFDDGTYKIMTVRKGYHSYFVKQIMRELNLDMKSHMLGEKNLPESPQDGIKSLCEGNRLVYVEFRENIVHHAIPCKITELPKSMLHRNIGIGFPKHSPYKQILNRELNLFRSAGILHRMRIYLLSYKDIEEKEIMKEEYINVSIGHVFSIFFLLGSGIAIAVIIFFMEFLGFHAMTLHRLRCRQSYKRK